MLIELLISALSSEHGIVVATTRQTPLISRLRRQIAADPEFAPLSVIPSPHSPDEIWILHNAPQD